MVTSSAKATCADDHGSDLQALDKCVSYHRKSDISCASHWIFSYGSKQAPQKSLYQMTMADNNELWQMVTAKYRELNRVQWYRTPQGVKHCAKDYTLLPDPNSSYIGTLDEQQYLGPVHRCKIHQYHRQFYIAVQVPSQRNNGMLVWVNVWCSHNHHRDINWRGGITFAKKVNSNPWYKNGWTNIYLQH